MVFFIPIPILFISFGIPNFVQHSVHLHQRCSLVWVRLQDHCQHFNKLFTVSTCLSIVLRVFFLLKGFEVNQVFDIFLKLFFIELEALEIIAVLHRHEKCSMKNCHSQTEYPLFSESIFGVIFLEVSHFLRGIIDRIIIFDNAPVLVVDHLVVDNFKHSIGHNVDAPRMQR